MITLTDKLTGKVYGPSDGEDKHKKEKEKARPDALPSVTLTDKRTGETYTGANPGVSDPLMKPERETVQPTAARESPAEQTYGITKVAPGTPGGGGRGTPGKADLWKDVFSPQAIRAGFQRDVEQKVADATDGHFDPLESAALGTFNGMGAFSLSKLLGTIGGNSYIPDAGMYLTPGNAAIADEMRGQSEEMYARNRDTAQMLNQDLKQAAEEQPFAYGAGELAGILALMGTVGKAAEAIPGLEAANPIVRAAVTGGATMGGSAAIRGAGDVATGGITPGEYGRSVASGAIGGAAGGAASAAVANAGLNLLRSFNKPGQFVGAQNKILPNILLVGGSSAAYGFSSSTIDELSKAITQEDYSPDWKQIRKNTLTAAAFSAISYTINLAQTTAASKEYLNSMNENLRRKYELALIVFEDSNASAAEKANYAEQVILDTENLRNYITNLHVPGGNNQVSSINDYLMSVEQELFSYMRGLPEASGYSFIQTQTNPASAAGIESPMVKEAKTQRAVAPIAESGYNQSERIAPEEGTNYGNLSRRPQEEPGVGEGAARGAGPESDPVPGRTGDGAPARTGGQTLPVAVDRQGGRGSERVNALKAAAITPREGSIAEEIANQAKNEYGIESHVIPESVWRSNGMGNEPVKSSGGEIYLSDSVGEEDRAIAVPHEATHIMWQTSFPPYMEFRATTDDHVDFSSPTGRQLITMAWDHITKSNGFDDLIATLESDDPKSIALRNRLYDEINATVYGYYVNGITSGTLEDGSTMDFRDAFHDFDAYTSKLKDLHEQFKRERSSGADYGRNDKDVKSLEKNGGERNAWPRDIDRRSETKQAFRARSAERHATTYSIGETTYAYRRVGLYDSSYQAERASREAKRLGIKNFLFRDMEVNSDGWTEPRHSAGITIGRSIVGFNADMGGNGIETVGHEAFHYWAGNAGSEFADYAVLLVDNIKYDSYIYNSIRKNVEFLYRKKGLSPQQLKGIFFEEVLAEISGRLHAAEPDDYELQSMFTDYSAVKAAWDNLVNSEIAKKNAGGKQKNSSKLTVKQQENSEHNQAVRFSSKNTPKQDADYLAAVERGDTETAQKMVDEAAKAAGYDTPELPVDYLSILDLGYGPVSASKLRDLLTMGEVERYVEDGKIRFRRANRTE